MDHRESIEFSFDDRCYRLVQWVIALTLKHQYWSSTSLCKLIEIRNGCNDPPLFLAIWLPEKIYMVPKASGGNSSRDDQSSWKKKKKRIHQCISSLHRFIVSSFHRSLPVFFFEYSNSYSDFSFQSFKSIKFSTEINRGKKTWKIKWQCNKYFHIKCIHWLGFSTNNQCSFLTAIVEIITFFQSLRSDDSVLFVYTKLGDSRPVTGACIF